MNPVETYKLQELFQKTFGSQPYQVPPSGKGEAVEPFQIQASSQQNRFTAKGSVLSETLKGVEVWLPVKFYEGSSLLMSLPYTVVKISGKKTIIETAVAERRGTVKEQFNIDDYSISVKGFLIGEDRQWPEGQMEQLRSLYEKGSAVTMDNALTNIFLTDPTLSNDEQRRVVIKDLDFAEVTGGRIHVRPFSMSIVSDSVFTLEINS